MFHLIFILAIVGIVWIAYSPDWFANGNQSAQLQLYGYLPLGISAFLLCIQLIRLLRIILVAVCSTIYHILLMIVTSFTNPAKAQINHPAPLTRSPSAVSALLKKILAIFLYSIVTLVAFALFGIAKYYLEPINPSSFIAQYLEGIAVLVLLFCLWGFIYELILSPIISLWNKIFGDKTETYERQQQEAVRNMATIEQLVTDAITKARVEYEAENARLKHRPPQSY